MKDYPWQEPDRESAGDDGSNAGGMSATMTVSENAAIRSPRVVRVYACWKRRRKKIQRRDRY